MASAACWSCVLLAVGSSVLTLHGQEGTPPPGFEVEVSEAHIEHLYRQLQRAREARLAGQLSEAEELLKEVMDVQPNNLAVAHELRLIRELQNVPSAVPEEASGSLSPAAIELARAETRVWLKRIDLLITEGHYSRAQEAVRSAQIHLQTYAWPEAEEAVAQLAERLARVSEQEVYDAEQASRALRQQASDQAQEMRQIEEAAERSVFTARLERIIALQQRGHFERALAQARHLVADYPNQQSGQSLYDRLLVAVYEQRELDIEQRKDAYETEVFERIHQALVPDGLDGMPQFPEDWRERSRRQLTSLDGEVVIPQWQEVLLGQLTQRLSVEFDNVDALEALEFIAQRAAINLVVSSEVRMAANPPLSITVRGMRVDNLLSWICQQLGTNWRLHRQAVFIGGDEYEPPLIRVYDLTESVFDIPDFPGPDPSRVQLSSPGSDGSFGADLFANIDGLGAGVDTVGIGADDVMDLIREAIDPQAWDNLDYSMEVRSGSYLMVNAPPRLHALIQELLRSQMRVNRTMVRTDLRWLELQDSYIEEIGIDWGGASNNLLQPGGNLGNNGFRRDGSGSSFASRIVNRLPETAIDMAPSLMTGGLNLHVVNLGAAQLQGMLTAVERTNRGREVYGIELVSLHGQRAHAMFLSQVAYISGYESDGGILAPVFSTVNAGHILDIRPLVSADRKYVTMDLRPISATVTMGIERIAVLTEIAEQVVVTSFPIELPTLRLNTVGTRVMIPDGGSIMVGGFTDARNQTAQSNVPLLGHVPFVGRLFGKRGRYSQNTQMILTVTVDIILYDEEEELL